MIIKRISNRFCTLLSLIVTTLNGVVFNSPINAKPTIERNPGRQTIEQMQGTHSIHVVSIQMTQHAQGMAARVVPEHLPWVSVSSASLGALQHGQRIDLHVAISLPVDAPIDTYDGVIQLRRAVPGQAQQVLAKPLPIVLNVTELMVDGLPPDPDDIYPALAVRLQDQASQAAASCFPCACAQ